MWTLLLASVFLISTSTLPAQEDNGVSLTSLKRTRQIKKGREALRPTTASG
jgi:hypothetical protein